MPEGMTVRREFELRDGRPFRWRAATADDAPMVWSWWTDPAMAYWARDARLESVASPPFDEGTVRTYLEDLLGTPEGERRLDPIVGEIDAEPVAYAELWTKGRSPLAGSELLTEIEDEARGMHLIVADRRSRLRGVTVEIGVDAIDWQFDDWPEITHGIADPDVRNQGTISLCARLGMRRVALVSLPYKTACVMALDRKSWQQERSSINELLDRLLNRLTREKAR